MSGIADIGTELVRERRAQGLSQRELGERLGVKRQQVARWESTSYLHASLGTVSRAAGALGFDALVVDGAMQLVSPASTGVPQAAPPVRDLGEIVARARGQGEELRDRFHVSKLGVFGSFVYAEQSEASDVDVIVEYGGAPARRTEVEDFLADLFGRSVDVVTAGSLRWEIKDRVLAEVVRVWAA
jgi:uncharacterized protein